MSVQFGTWNIDGKPVEPDYLEKVKQVLRPYGPDDAGAYVKNGIGMLYHAFHTTKESSYELQPHETPSGAVITWDGRLDNRAELIGELPNIPANSSDVSIVAAAYAQWDTDCFAKLLGDWALSVWDAYRRLLILAKDPVGVRHLYYSIDQDQVTWCTIVDPLALFAGHPFVLNEEYVAGWLSLFPAAHLTPYKGIHSVPPSSSVHIREGKHAISKYWDFDPTRKIRHRTDVEYEEDFRDVFSKAVRRRLRSNTPVLAELSGGMDSSSIVCMADTIIDRGIAETRRLDTISYYNDSEPHWNERPYFASVEEKRDRVGTHIDVGALEPCDFDLDRSYFAAVPNSSRGRRSKTSHRLDACLHSQGNRVILSGIGGDELTGGFPTPTLELQDLLATGQLRTLAHQLKAWALYLRKPWFLLFSDAARAFFPRALRAMPEHRRPVAWLNPDFAKRHRNALEGYERRRKLFGPLPTFQDSLLVLDALRRQLESYALPSDPLYENRYPYLDRDFLEFIHAIPREQLVRPGQRRSLMRRALHGIVPDEILERKRKAYVTRGPVARILADWDRYAALTQHLISEALGIVDGEKFFEALQKVRRGEEVPLVPLLRTLQIEMWLRNLAAQRFFQGLVPNWSELVVPARAKAMSFGRN